MTEEESEALRDLKRALIESLVDGAANEIAAGKVPSLAASLSTSISAEVLRSLDAKLASQAPPSQQADLQAKDHSTADKEDHMPLQGFAKLIGMPIRALATVTILSAIVSVIITALFFFGFQMLLSMHPNQSAKTHTINPDLPTASSANNQTVIQPGTQASLTSSK